MNEQLLDRLRHLVETIPPVLDLITEEEFSFKPIPDKWSKKQILGHLIDSAANNHHRFVRTQYETLPTVSYNQDQWNKYGYYQNFSSRQLIRFWSAYNWQLLELVQYIPDECLQLKCIVDNNAIMTLETIFDIYVNHLEHHLKQITGTEWN